MIPKAETTSTPGDLLARASRTQRILHKLFPQFIDEHLRKKDQHSQELNAELYRREALSKSGRILEDAKKAIQVSTTSDRAREQIRKREIGITTPINGEIEDCVRSYSRGIYDYLDEAELDRDSFIGRMLSSNRFGFALGITDMVEDADGRIIITPHNKDVYLVGWDEERTTILEAYELGDLVERLDDQELAVLEVATNDLFHYSQIRNTAEYCSRVLT